MSNHNVDKIFHGSVLKISIAIFLTLIAVFYYSETIAHKIGISEHRIRGTITFLLLVYFGIVFLMIVLDPRKSNIEKLEEYPFKNAIFNKPKKTIIATAFSILCIGLSFWAIELQWMKHPCENKESDPEKLYKTIIEEVREKLPEITLATPIYQQDSIIQNVLSLSETLLNKEFANPEMQHECDHCIINLKDSTQAKIKNTIRVEVENMINLSNAINDLPPTNDDRFIGATNKIIDTYEPYQIIDTNIIFIDCGNGMENERWTRVNGHEFEFVVARVVDKGKISISKIATHNGYIDSVFFKFK